MEEQQAASLLLLPGGGQLSSAVARSAGGSPQRREEEAARGRAAPLRPSVARSLLQHVNSENPPSLPLSHEERAIQQCSVVYMNVCTVQPAGASSHTYGLPAFPSLRPRPSHSKNEVCSIQVGMGEIKSKSFLA